MPVDQVMTGRQLTGKLTEQTGGSLSGPVDFEAAAHGR